MRERNTPSTEYLIAQRDAALEAMRWYPSGSEELYKASVTFMLADGLIRARENDEALNSRPTPGDA